MDLALLAEREREERARAAAALTTAARDDHIALADCLRAVIAEAADGPRIGPPLPKRGPGPRMSDWL